LSETQSELRLEWMRLESCPACRGEKRERLFGIQHSILYECGDCRLRYLDPCLSPNSMKAAYESEEHLVDLHGFHKGYFLYGDLSKASQTATDFRRALRLLDKQWRNVPEDRRILDVGFGNGLFLAVAQKEGWRVDGIDSSRRNVDLAARKFSLKLSCSSLEDWEPGDGIYDAVSFWDVIEHLPNPDIALQKCHKLLKPNGLVLIGLPNDKSALAFIACWLYRASFGGIKKGIESIYFLEHVAYYTLEALHTLLARNGFLLRDHFFTSTDLAKYTLPLVERWMASGLLWVGRLLGLENRLVAVFQKNGGH